MVDTTVKDSSSQENVVEKRIKPTVIRRRKVKAPKEEPVLVEAAVEGAAVEVEVEEKPKTVAATTVAIKEGETVEKKQTPKAKQEKSVAVIPEKRKSLKIISQPDEPVKATVDGQTVIKTADADEKDKLIKKPARKRKTKAELQYEDIRKAGGLKQYVRRVDEIGEKAPVHEKSRVFKPTAYGRKKKPVKKAYKQTAITEKKAIKKKIKISEGITISELSQLMGIKANEIIKKIMALGLMATMNQSVDTDTAALIASEYGYEVENIAFKEDDVLKVSEKVKGVGESCPPVVTVMGHVDHGKTSILDIIRNADVASGEAGGITQHIGAYTVVHNSKKITFVDTPGHEAFTHMRARGAKVTDIVILVVAADDGVMPQTKEAIDHAKAAEVPIIVAVNKVDKPNASIDKVKRELSEVGLVPEDWGGDTICVSTSAKLKQGIDELLEMVLLQSEMLDLKAESSGRAEGIVIEARMDKRRGPLVTCIVKKGCLRTGDYLVIGSACGKARALVNDKGAQVKEVFPSEPVEILGLSLVPEAGELFIVVEDEKTSKQVAENRQQKHRQEMLTKKSKVTLEDLTSRLQDGETKELNLIVKTDVKGVADAVKDSLPGLGTKEVKIKVIHTGVGGITEGDVMLASASNAVILGFNVVADVTAREVAEREGVEVKTYSVIYEMLDDIKKAIVGLLTPKEVEKVLGRAEVRDTFKVPKVGVIAGCYVSNGCIKRSAKVRLLRDNVIIHSGDISSLRRFKDDAKEVATGLECGISIEKFGDIKIGDEIEAYEIQKIETTWDQAEK